MAGLGLSSRQEKEMGETSSLARDQRTMRGLEHMYLSTAWGVIGSGASHIRLSREHQGLEQLLNDICGST